MPPTMIPKQNPVNPAPLMSPSCWPVKPNCAPQVARIPPRMANPTPAARIARNPPQSRRLAFGAIATLLTVTLLIEALRTTARTRWNRCLSSIPAWRASIAKNRVGCVFASSWFILRKQNPPQRRKDAKRSGGGTMNQNLGENLNGLKALVGQEVAVTDYPPISQERVNQFAETTEDRQWIHVDVDRAKRESPYGNTIAHGFLTLALLSSFLSQSLSFKRPPMGVNYGLHPLPFPPPRSCGAAGVGAAQ